MSKKFIFSLSMALLVSFSNVKAGEILPLAVDLQKTANTAKKYNIPVVIFFTATWCHYCKKLEENIIHPLLETTNIEDYAEFRQVIMDRAHWQMKDFSGKDIEMKTFPPSQKVIVAPTTHVYNSKGELIAEPILGLTLEEFYPGNLEQVINQGLKALGNDKRVDIYKMIKESKVQY
ncbi:thioredoxin family protein [Thiomicrorhabdus sp. Milos-T2]|uniref:thioredoxin family protein n=1 Tax=Thiomicrorhabdus sp. Milos-T2 TaxID=90814 RepID=UPI00049434C1|nr:thioredoxin family protein [Thiomicrorhabdus sp. Milos-T2]